MAAGAPRGVEGRAGRRPRRTVMLTGAPFRGTGVLGGPGRGPGTATPGPCRATGRAGGGDREGGEVLLYPWSAAPGSRSRLDFAGPRGVPWSPPRVARGATARGRSLDQRPWYVDFFDGDYLRIFGPVLPSERTAAEVNAVVERLGLPRGARLLDLGCGQGRHAVPLAQLGYQVVGLDLRRPLLDRAAARAGGGAWARATCGRRRSPTPPSTPP